MKNLYLISQDVNDDYNVYDSAVVCATDEDAARIIHPDRYEKDQCLVSWCMSKDVQVTHIGIAHQEIKLNSVICASFNSVHVV